MKHPVPKQKQSKARSAKRRGMFNYLNRTRLTEQNPIVACKHCGDMTKSHNVCQNCGYLGDRMVVDKMKKVDQITKIKA